MAVRSDPVPFAIGDVVRLKKSHPCGSVDWTVVRLGADIGLKCHGCGRRVLLARRDLERRLKTFVSRTESDTHDPMSEPPATAAEPAKPCP